jgi:predicted GH43/DUF377 family glycosyl hydrolase
MSEIILTQNCLESGGLLKPLLVPLDRIDGPSLSNPSVYVDKEEILVNLRNLNYILYHSEKSKFEHIWGPLCYLHQENDCRLVTNNIFCKLDKDLNITDYRKIDTLFLDETPLWEFVGLEDGRLIKWNNKIYLSGVRRDTTPNGVGRMELSEIKDKKEKTIEISRLRIPAPPPDNSYCEKNWMPVLDRPYTYVKWTNPTEVVEVNPTDKTCKTVILGENKAIDSGDLRGGSQVIPLGDYYLAIVHEVDLFKSEAGKKNATYRHRFVVWDKNFNLLEVSDKFSLMGANIEFCCGMAEFQDNLLITFGFQDNAAYILSMPKNMLGNFLKIYA